MNSLSLKELNCLIKETLDIQLEPSYWVIAEIAEIRPNQKGHCYLELIQKEDDMLVAKSKATIWSYAFRSISSWFEAITGKKLKPGMKILANVCVQFHELYGLSLNIKEIDPNFTLGERARKRQQVIDQLLADGIFEMNKEIPMPLVTQRIAVISSASAAGFGDFVDQIEKNAAGYSFKIRLFQALMQGDQAKDSVIEAMHKVFTKSDQFDVLVIIRGGGAQADLDCFDTYEMAAHVAQFPLPVLTGIGHERDETVVDLVAHTRLKTPTAVAEYLICSVKDFDYKLNEIKDRLFLQTAHYLSSQEYQLERLGQDLKYSCQQKFSDIARKIELAGNKLHYLTNLDIKNKHIKLDFLAVKLKKSPSKFITAQNEKLNNLTRQFKLLDPENVLKRGFSITTANGVLINKLEGLKPSAVIKTETRTLKIISRIEDISEK